MATTYIILSAETAAALQDLVTGSLNSGYTLLGGVQISGSGFVQSMVIQEAGYQNFLTNPERLSKSFRANVTGSWYEGATASYK